MEDVFSGVGGYAGNAVETTKSVGPETMKQKLSYAVQRAEKQLADAKRAKEILDAHPELEELLNILQRQRF